MKTVEQRMFERWEKRELERKRKEKLNYIFLATLSIFGIIAIISIFFIVVYAGLISLSAIYYIFFV